MDGFLGQALVFLIAGVIAVPIANRLGLGSVLGYLLAGIALSPILPAIGIDAETLLHFAEFGVVMMLFIIGLELSPKLLWQMRTRLLGLGGAQVLITAALIAGACLVIGLEWRASIAVGLILSLSSTAIVLKTLEEKALMKTEGGRASFAILLFQDVAVIPILAILPLLMVPGGFPSEEVHAESAIHDMPGWMQAGMLLGRALFGGGALILAALPRWITPSIAAGTRMSQSSSRSSAPSAT